MWIYLIFSLSLSAPQALAGKQERLMIKKNSVKAFPKIYNPEVQRWIDFFGKNHPSYLKLWLKRSYRYFPLMKEIFESKALPKELLSMSLVESGLSSQAVSSAQAVGYWQFIRPTAREFGLTVNHWIDERKDFEKSTQAAAEYLSKLYIEFEDWLLAMAAYNMGENRLRKLIKKHKSINFWELYKKADFPRETALYIPKILAVNHILKSPSAYGLNEFIILMPYKFDIFFIPGGIPLKKLSVEIKSTLEELKKLNPALKKHKIPDYIASYPLRIPKGRGRLLSYWLDKQNK